MGTDCLVMCRYLSRAHVATAERLREQYDREQKEYSKQQQQQHGAVHSLGASFTKWGWIGLPLLLSPLPNPHWP